MGFGKLMSMGVMGFLSMQHQDMIKEQVNFMGDSMPVIQTQIEMESMKSGLATYAVTHDGKLPKDLEGFLSKTYSTGEKDAGIDRWGNPYEPYEDDEEGIIAFRSCGPDGECDTDDDIMMRIFSSKKAPDIGVSRD